VRGLTFALLLSACAPSIGGGTGRYLLTTQTNHGPIIWHRFTTLEACEEARRESDPDFATICTTADGQQRPR
jgi:hypothetical protein